MRKLLYLLGLVDVVWLQWDQGRPVLRIVRGRTPEYFIRYFDSRYTLEPGGKTQTPLMNWFPYEEKPAKQLTATAIFGRPKGVFRAWVVTGRLQGK